MESLIKEGFGTPHAVYCESKKEESGRKNCKPSSQKQVRKTNLVRPNKANKKDDSQEELTFALFGNGGS